MTAYQPSPDPADPPVSLISGGAARIGRATTKRLHAAGNRVIIHYNNSHTQANALCAELCKARPNSAAIVSCDLTNIDALMTMANQAINIFGRIDHVINNASTFYPTPIGDTTEADWSGLIDVNLKAPYFLVQALAHELKARRGAIVNIGDIYASRPLEDHPVYCAAKAGLLALTRSFARELAPYVRANAVLPGAILWPDNPSGANQGLILSRTPLARCGDPEDIANTILFLLHEAPFISGQEIAVDGGRSVMP